MKLKIRKAIFWFDRNFAWFFTNGRNQKHLDEYLRIEEEEIRKLENLKSKNE